MNIIDGKKISKEIFAELKEKIKSLSLQGKNITLVDIQVGNDDASNVYIENKCKILTEAGIKFLHTKYNFDITEDELIKKIKYYNNDSKINAIFVELPLPKHINEKKVIDAIDYKKDVDGFNIKNVGALTTGLDGFFPCTAEGIIELLKRSNIEVAEKYAVIVGRSNIVGKPVALMLLNKNATVTICHSKTTNLKEICKNADILIVANGKKKSIDENFIKNNAIVIDVGIHKEIINGKKIISGDVDFEKVKDKCSYITPVPGGVGPMTIMMLINHLIKTVE